MGSRRLEQRQPGLVGRDGLIQRRAHRLCPGVVCRHSRTFTIIADPQGDILLLNREAERLFGYVQAELMGQKVELLVPENLIDAHVRHRAAYIAAPQKGRVMALELSARRKDSSIFPADIHLRYIQAPNGDATIIHIVDITQRQQAEEMLKRSLAHQIEVNELRARFVSMASYDLRTPLSVIHTSSEILRGHTDALSTERRQQQLDRIDSAGQEMADLLDDILALTEIETAYQTYEPQLLDMLAFVQSVVDELQQLDQNVHRLTIHSTLPGAAQIDPKLLRQILANLLSNAIKYSPPGTEINIDLYQKDERLYLRVQDQGIGIPAESIPRLFDPFHRAANTQQVKGTGLGLPIVKRCVELHQGTIEVESQIGHGTTCTVQLPLR